MSKSNERTPNDQRADALNETSKEYKSAQDHNSNLYNPNSEEYKADQDNRAKQAEHTDKSKVQ